MARRRAARPLQPGGPTQNEVWWVEEVQGGPSVLVRVLSVDGSGNVQVELLTPPRHSVVGVVPAEHVPALFRQRAVSALGELSHLPPPLPALPPLQPTKAAPRARKAPTPRAAKEKRRPRAAGVEGPMFGPGAPRPAATTPAGARVLDLPGYEASVLGSVEAGETSPAEARRQISQARGRVKKAEERAARARTGERLAETPLRPEDPRVGDRFVFHRERGGQHQSQTMTITGAWRDQFKNGRLELTYDAIDYEGHSTGGHMRGKQAEGFLKLVRRHGYVPGSGIQVVVPTRPRGPMDEPATQLSIVYPGAAGPRLAPPAEPARPRRGRARKGPPAPAAPPVSRPPTLEEQGALMRDFPQFAAPMPAQELPPTLPPLAAMPEPPPVMRPRAMPPGDWATGGAPRVTREAFHASASGDQKAGYLAGSLLGFIPAEEEVEAGSPRVPMVRLRHLLLQLLHDGQARTWERISRELTGRPGVETGGSPLEQILWELVADRELEYRLAPPVLFRIRRPAPAGAFVPAGAPAPGESWVVENQGVHWPGVVLDYDPTGPMGGFVTVRPSGAPQGDPGVVVMAGQLVRRL